jgi:hypothetical protein
MGSWEISKGPFVGHLHSAPPYLISGGGTNADHSDGLPEVFMATCKQICIKNTYSFDFHANVASDLMILCLCPLVFW